MGPSWAPVGSGWAPVGPQLVVTGAKLGMGWLDRRVKPTKGFD